MLVTALISIMSANANAIAGASAAHLPLLFSQEGSYLKTSACIMVEQKKYAGSHASWNSFEKQAKQSPEAEFAETINAIKRMDSAVLKSLSHSQHGRDPKQFQEQAIAYFQQFGFLTLGNVHSHYRFADYTVFFLQLGLKEKASVASFSFAKDATGKYGFLPYGGRSITLSFLNQWLNSGWGPAKTKSPVYCGPTEIERATHKVALESAAESASELLLRGKRLTDKNVQHAKLLKTIAALNKALDVNNMADYFKHFTPQGADKVSRWYANATTEDQNKYTESLLDQKPFFVFEADPLYIVYARTANSGVQALYFVQDQHGVFRWANAAYGSVVDSIFKSPRFISAASQAKPFNAWKIANANESN